MDALGFVDPADARSVIGDGAHRTGFLTGPLLMNDGAIGTGFGALTAGLAFVGFDAHLGVAGGDGAESAGIQAGLAQAEAADIRDEIILNGTIIAGGGDDGHHVLGRRTRFRAHTLGEANAAPDDLPLLIDTATVLWLWSRANLADNLFRLLLRQPILPRQAADLPQDKVLQFYDPFVVCDHVGALVCLNVVIRG